MFPVVVLALAFADAVTLPGFRPSAWFGEQVREEWIADGVRVHVTAPPRVAAWKVTRLIVYATPNGNSIEQTLGCGPATGLDWHFDIQHVAAQVRTLRENSPDENVVLAVVEADGLSWPAWRRKHTAARVSAVVEAVRGWVPAKDVRLTLAGHSGGGSFLFGYLDAADAIPAAVERIVFLDANYSYADPHGGKLLAWLTGDKRRRLTVVAYDDRNITLNGKPVVGPDGGTFRATDRMHARFARDVTFTDATLGDVRTRTALDGRLELLVHTNPKNAILHTALVGEMNGLLHGAADLPFGEPRAYTKWVQPAPGIPPRPADAVGGPAFFRTLDTLSRTEREAAVLREVLRGNVPDFLRTFRTVAVTANGHTAAFEVMPDYLAVGSDADFVRVPMTPQTAARIADAFGCALPTRKIVDDLYRAATVKLDPKPLTQDREAAATFWKHNAIIEGQRAGQPLGELVAGVKKDVVVSNRLAERPHRVAIYGWHMPDGKPIQPLTIVHVDWYVDYSHGVRLMKRSVTIDGKPRDVQHALSAADSHPLLSDEGPIVRPAY